MWDEKLIRALPLVVPGLAVLLLTAAYIVLYAAV
jgi:hypothetical protein